MLDDTSSLKYIDKVGCIPRCKFTMYHMHKMFDSNFDSLIYAFNKTDGANQAVSKVNVPWAKKYYFNFLQISIMFPSTEITVMERIWVYDGNDFFADVGGFLGLLLGASCFTLAEV